MFEIILSPIAEKQLKKLPDEVRARVISSLERCRIRPYAYVKKLVGSPYFRLRVGKYRVIMDIKKGLLVIEVVEIGHRESIYK